MLSGLAAAMTNESTDRDPSGPETTTDPSAVAADDDPEARWIRAAVGRRLFGRDEAAPTIGRYPILTRLGEGGMGVVYACYDEQLDRRVAVKVLRAEIETTDVRARLVREAQAMAMLDHPNVAHVYEVGEHEGRAFVAMEFVGGVTLRSWLAARRRPWSEVLAVLLAAGEGLAAAHDKGLTHRDFKPDNVMVGDDPHGHGVGRVRVMDFGLVHVDAVTLSAELHETSPGRRVHVEALTSGGALLGTPAYMAPEQLRRREVGPAADQFAFCVTLWEALYGERPFAGKSLADLAQNVLDGKLREPTPGSGAPPWLRRVLDRGLQTAPERRFGSMRELLDVLRRGAGRRRRIRVLATIGGIAGAALVSVMGWRLELERRRAACSTEADAIDEVWNDEERDRVRQALVATGVSYAADSYERMVPFLDAFVGQWRTGYTGACVADVDGASGPAWVTSRDCFASRKDAVASLVDVFRTRADPELVQRTVVAAAKLPPVEDCRDETWLARNPALPQGDARIDDLRRALSQATSLQAAGRYRECFVAAQSVVDDDAAELPPRLRRLALMEAGHCADYIGDYDTARRLLTEAFDVAVASGDDEGARAAATSLVYAIGSQQDRYDEALVWGRVALALLVRLGEEEEIAAADVYGNVGSVHQARGEYDEAKRLFEHALAIEERALGPDHFDLARTLNNLGTLHRVRGEYDDALRCLQRALAIKENTLGPEHPGVITSIDNLAVVHWARAEYDAAWPLHERALALAERVHGPDHPAVANALNNFGNLHGATGDFAGALRLHERALRIREQSFGAEHPDVATSLNNVANSHRSMSAYAEAIPLFERAVAIREKALGPEHPGVAVALNNLGTSHAAQRAFDVAEPLLRRALAIREKALGAEHPAVAESLVGLGDVRREQGTYEQAAADYRRALAIGEKALGADHPDLGDPLLGLARIELATRDPEAALAHARRALAVRDQPGLAPAQRADAQFVLAQALLALGQTAEARASAARARDGLASAGDHARDQLAEVDAWLAAHAR